MSKAVMLSIRPKWCERIASGEKTIEVRKTRPKLDTPFKCYIYCTQSGVALGAWGKHGKVIGEFTCDRIYKIDKDSTDFLFKAGGLSVYKQAAEEKCGLCVAMTDDELHGYLGHCQGYGWHISGLKIYDAPKDLNEFHLACLNSWYCESCAMYCENNGTCGNESLQIRRPPQSWCYVEAM
jgi:predicted transcriptional regulator|nr:MAG TPA: hypothetical protein [Caudoviricetes sp.]